MPLEKRNVVESHRTPASEEKRADADWDRDAASGFTPVEPTVKPEVKDGGRTELA